MRRKSFECSRILMEGENNMETVFTSANFDADVLGSEIPVVVDFFATWCGPCKVLSPTVEALGKELAGQVRVLKIDVDKNEALATQLRIQSVPTLIIFKKGEIVWRSSGVMDHGSLLQKVQSYID